MIRTAEPDNLSPRRARLASFEHAYAVAAQRRRASGRLQFVVCTGNPLQPFRTTSRTPRPHERMLALLA
jgi:hypothetical protein